jgi:hypothetical protein
VGSPKRVDQNQSEIVAALRRVGCSVQILSDVGHGCPDLLVGCVQVKLMGEPAPWTLAVNILMEVKSPTGKLNSRESLWHCAWCGQVAVVRTVEEALAMVGAKGDG